MGKTAKDMDKWKIASSKPPKPGDVDYSLPVPTPSALKKIIDLEISNHLTLKKWKKITVTELGNIMNSLSKKYNIKNGSFISLNKNGKTVKVNKLPVPKITIDDIGISAKLFKEFNSPLKKISVNKPSGYGAKQLKAVNQDLYNKELGRIAEFHLFRKHAMEYDSCLACKAIKGYIQWMFHHKKKNKLITSGMAGAITKGTGQTISVPKINKFTAQAIIDDHKLSTSPITVSSWEYHVGEDGNPVKK